MVSRDTGGKGGRVSEVQFVHFSLGRLLSHVTLVVVHLDDELVEVLHNGAHLFCVCTMLIPCMAFSGLLYLQLVPTLPAPFRAALPVTLED